MFALIGLVEEESVMEDECALAYSRFVPNLAPTPLAPLPRGNRSRKLLPLLSRGEPESEIDFPQG